MAKQAKADAKDVSRKIDYAFPHLKHWLSKTPNVFKALYAKIDDVAKRYPTALGKPFEVQSGNVVVKGRYNYLKGVTITFVTKPEKKEEVKTDASKPEGAGGDATKTADAK